MQNTAIQLTLFTQRQKQRQLDTDLLATHLSLVPRWQTRKEIMAALEWTDRRCRAAGENSNGRIIFGQRGFKHLDHSTPDEVRACINTLYSQSQKNATRAREIQRRYHRMGCHDNLTAL